MATRLAGVVLLGASAARLGASVVDRIASVERRGASVVPLRASARAPFAWGGAPNARRLIRVSFFATTLERRGTTGATGNATDAAANTNPTTRDTTFARRLVADAPRATLRTTSAAINARGLVVDAPSVTTRPVSVVVDAPPASTRSVRVVDALAARARCRMSPPRLAIERAPLAPRGTARAPAFFCIAAGRSDLMAAARLDSPLAWQRRRWIRANLGESDRLRTGLYIETHFVLELVLEQEQSGACGAIVALAEAVRLSLVLPAFCLVEPFETMARRKHEQGELVRRMERPLREVGRTATLSTEGEELKSTARAVLARSTEQAERRFDAITTRLLGLAELSELGPQVLRDAAQHRKDDGLSPPDSPVLASVLGDLASRPGPPQPSCFLHRNSRDFGDPTLVVALEVYLCKTLLRFDAGLAFVQHARLP